jgi:hypothetical protein
MNVITSAMTTASKLACESPWRNCTIVVVGRLRAYASWPSDGSIAVTLAGAQRLTSTSVKAPFPHPTSSHRIPFGTSSQSRKASPTGWLHRPINRS